MSAHLQAVEVAHSSGKCIPPLLITVHPVLSNLIVFPDLDAFDTLRRLYDNFGTRRTFSNLHIWELPSGRSVSRVTISSAVACRMCPSPIASPLVEFPNF